MTDIFISHCAKDKNIAALMCSFLNSHGFRSMTSDGYTARINTAEDTCVNALSTMRVFIFIYSDNSKDSERVAYQLELALNRPGTIILPYRLNNAPISERYETIFRHMERIDAYTVKNGLRFEQVCSTAARLMNSSMHGVPYTGNGTYFVRPKKNYTGLISAALISLLFGGTLLNYMFRGIRSERNRAAVPETAAVNEVSADEDPSFSFNAVYIDTAYSGEYTGEVGKNGLPDGIGEFKGVSDEKNGQNTITYSGEFRNGAIHGKGRCRFENANGYSYEYDGYFENGMTKGRGSLKASMTEADVPLEYSCEGIWLDNRNARSYKETDRYLNGITKEYLGSLKDGQISGKSTMRIKYLSGDIKEEFYQGTWKNGFLDGNADIVINYINGDVCEFKGGYSNEKWNGEGVKIYTYASGDIKEIKHEGTWTDNVLSGRITKTITYNNGDTTVYKGDCADNVPGGKGTETTTYKTGELKKRIYKGEWKQGSYNGKGVLTISYAKDTNEKDKTVIEGTWEEGELGRNIKKTEHYKNGDTEEYIGEYINDNRNGSGTLTFTDKASGKKWTAEGSFDNGSLFSGEKIYYDKNGKAVKTEIYKHGKAEETKE